MPVTLPTCTLSMDDHCHYAFVMAIIIINNMQSSSWISCSAMQLGMSLMNEQHDKDLLDHHKKWSSGWFIIRIALETPRTSEQMMTDITIHLAVQTPVNTRTYQLR